MLHGYAITCHVAQGMTVDRSFNLADSNLARELAYTALSRGRAANHLYLARHPEDARAEYAPGSGTRIDPLERLVAALTTSRARVLAIDAGPKAISDQLAEARRDLAELRAASRRLEDRRWSPRRKADLRSVRTREAAASQRVAELTRVATEHCHANQPFVDRKSLDQRAAAGRDRSIERQVNHHHSRGLER